MSIHPCPIRIDCDDQNPFANLSVEGPEPFWVPPPGTYWTAKGYCCDNTLKQVYSASSQDNADDLLQRTLVTACPTCEEQQKYCANATCPDGSNLQEVCVTTSQDDANALAAIAEAAMAPFCDNKEELYRADCACPDGVTDPHTVYSSIDQRVADAVCEAIPKDCGLDTPCNTPQTCVAPCPDGTLFSYTIAACTVKASTVELANAEAYRLACERALAQRVCLSPIYMCACKGEAYSANIAAFGVPPGTQITWQMSSGAPPGLTITAISTDGRATIYGTPTVNGIYSFTVRAITGLGTFAEKTYRIYVIEITTTSLPNITVGSPYTYQLEAAGGSGHYSWWIESGSLPDGLTLETTGLITGTPTSAAVSTVQFGVIDTDCTQREATQITPNVKLTTRSTTTLRKYKGYAEFTDLSSSTLYKKITWSGQVIQRATTSDGHACSGAKIVYSGSDEINAAGAYISNHKKELFVMCPSVAVDPAVAEGANAAIEVQAAGLFFGISTSRIHRLAGYCWPYDPNSCSSCPYPDTSWAYKADMATPAQFDLPTELLLDQNQSSIGATSYAYNHSVTNAPFSICAVNNFPGFTSTIIDGEFHQTANYAPITITSVGNFSATLSDPYTDADALASEETIVGTSKVAENRPKYLTTNFGGFLRSIWTRMTTVDYTMECKNLVPGRNYEATVTTETSHGVKTTVTNTFAATASVQTITGTVPTPDSGDTITVRSPKIRML